jgi:hypothetical protein
VIAEKMVDWGDVEIGRYEGRVGVVNNGDPWTGEGKIMED